MIAAAAAVERDAAAEIRCKGAIAKGSRRAVTRVVMLAAAHAYSTLAARDDAYAHCCCTAQVSETVRVCGCSKFDLESDSSAVNA